MTTSTRNGALALAAAALVASCQIDVGLGGADDFFACSTNADCRTGEVCSKKLCVVPDGGTKTGAGGEPADAGAGGTPQPDGGLGGGGGTGTGGVGSPCGDASACKPSLMCKTGPDWSGGYCTTQCQPPGSACADGSVCNPGAAGPTICFQRCADGSQCRGGYVCSSHGCVPDCRSSTGFCSAGACDKATGACAGDCTVTGCQAGATCDPVTRQCRASPCTACPAGTSCDASGACVPGGGADGGIGSNCAFGGGTTGCQPGLSCYHLSEAGSGMCSKACSNSVDCGVGADCYGGICFPLCDATGRCSRPDAACRKVTLRPVCVPNCKVYPDACAAGVTCNPDGTCG